MERISDASTAVENIQIQLRRLKGKFLGSNDPFLKVSKKDLKEISDVLQRGSNIHSYIFLVEQIGKKGDPIDASHPSIRETFKRTFEAKHSKSVTIENRDYEVYETVLPGVYICSVTENKHLFTKKVWSLLRFDSFEEINKHSWMPENATLSLD